MMTVNNTANLLAGSIKRATTLYSVDMPESRPH